MECGFTIVFTYFLISFVGSHYFWFANIFEKMERYVHVACMRLLKFLYIDNVYPKFK